MMKKVFLLLVTALMRTATADPLPSSPTPATAPAQATALPPPPPPPPPASPALSVAEVAKLIASHMGLALALLHMPDAAIEDASLVSRPEGAPIVRTRPANQLRSVGMFDFAVLRKRQFQLGGAVLVRPTDDWMLGVAVEGAFPVTDSLWLRVGCGVSAFRYTRLASGVHINEPLTTNELVPPTEFATGRGGTCFIGLGTVLDAH